ncbi:hypothetical protein [Rhizobium leguminosarum]|jgi:hypothetical protein|uniref:hypothetical protein n=1 Tax=Rhizobium TaxID=379 RepID=UPI0010306255|nr:hypothetical protein [Rhizobium leguminosarum]TBF70741.1 hypothetical protein ELG86_27640 [Rhizobium leguminosarum]TBG93389.1 hypothetical protein ELG70_38310 [Rhizobium leguminosarum]TBG95991.1 hypothetical protein ELG68_35555 [Rhizobium leguminosarum]TBH28769.1 hypothetical protein ELG66_34160 [Rhizobium leguminosarum]TBH50214.1 hypothetical protein ELG62_29810 [Rhizobium leguminosarum]
MTLLTGETDVFSAAGPSERCVVMFLARREGDVSGIFGDAERQAIAGVLDELKSEGWLLSIRAMFDAESNGEAMALDTGFTHSVDMAGVFEAPSISAAMKGTIRLERAGWARLFSTEWLIGPREFAPVKGTGGDIDRPWGFLALWEWNDSWAAATPDQRTEYDAECDIAFKGDLALDINIAGRHRLDWAHGWHHLGAWEARSPQAIDRAITGHEDVADFVFTTSRHFMGRIRPLHELLAA